MLKKHMRIYGMITLFLAGSSALLAPAQAQTSAWQTVEGGRLRLAIAPPASKEKDKAIYGTVELELEPGWKTYWSNPGNSGMPPAITLNQAAKADILFPAPQLLENGEDWAFGYKGHILLPFRITALQPELPQKISGSVLVGICNILCIPEKLPFQFTANETADTPTQERIKAALSALPEPAQGDFQIRELTAINGELHVLLRHPESAAAPQLFMDGHDMQLGIADVTRHEAGETLYTVPVLSGRISFTRLVSYTAVLNGQSISGATAIRQDKTRPD